MAREDAGLSQDQLGAAVSMTGKTIRRYEKSETTPDSNTISRIADVTGYPVSFFLSDAIRAAGAAPSAPGSDRGAAAHTRPHDARGAKPVSPSVYFGAVPTPHAEPVAYVAIEGTRLVETGSSGRVPPPLLRRVNHEADDVRLLCVPERHYALQRYLHPSDTLVLRLLDLTPSVATSMQRDRFADGRYVVGVGQAGLQVKTLTAHPGGSVALEAADGTQRFLYGPDELDGITLHARVVLCF